MKTKQVTTEHLCKDADDVGLALKEHIMTTRAAGIGPAKIDNVLELELVSFISGTLIIKTQVT